MRQKLILHNVSPFPVTLYLLLSSEASDIYHYALINTRTDLSQTRDWKQSETEICQTEGKKGKVRQEDEITKSKQENLSKIVRQ